MKILPIEFKQGTQEPTDQKLFDATEAWAQENLGSSINYSQYSRVWVRVLDDGRVIGALGLAWAIDIPMFHVTEPGEDRRERLEALRTSHALVERARSYLEDNGFRGKIVNVFVNPAATEKWEKFLEELNAKPANRFALEV